MNLESNLNNAEKHKLKTKKLSIALWLPLAPLSTDSTPSTKKKEKMEDEHHSHIITVAVTMSRTKKGTYIDT